MKRAAPVIGCALLLTTPAWGQPAPNTQAPAHARGYWWYEAPKSASSDKTQMSEKPEMNAVPKPVLPPMVELVKWSPPRIAKLIEQQRDYAATVLTIDAVTDFWRLEDFARRKARAFAGVTQLALLAHPELNARAVNPLVGEARDAMGAHKDDIRRQYLRAHGQEFALVMFDRTSCPYCRVQWPILQRFQDETGWQVTRMDIEQHPDLGQRFGVEVTPTTMVIRRGSRQRMVIAAGVETYPNLLQMAYQAIKLLTGDIRPEQWLTGAGEEDGFFDALANGPLSPGDPRVIGGNLVTAGGRKP